MASAERPRVFVTRRLPGDALERLSAVALVDVWQHDLPPSRDELVAAVREADGLICLLTDRIDAGVLDAAPRLRVVSTMAVGYDHIDVAAATARGIPVGHTPGVLTETTADLAWALLLATARRVVEGDRFVREGRWKTWDPNLLLGYDVHGATLGVVGMGAIGQAVARRAVGFGMRVLYTRRSAGEAEIGRRVSLEELLRESDFVSLHVPLTAETRHLIGERELRLMKRTAILINTARGPVVDQAALAAALREGVIAGAGVDVTEVEPIPPDDPLLAAPNVVILPHIGSASHATRARMAEMAVENCIAGLEGRPVPHCVNREVERGRQST
ncbi:MAG TPA: D-glycerate dehydrogenase [Dehalococcoidia bacterium]|nr:D-glycerate dehydrogenase [Dehalococcoidia bacterium]